MNIGFLAETHRVFGVLNGMLFGGALPEIKFICQPKRRKIVLRYEAEGQMVVGGGVVAVTRICFLGDLLHEMVHYYNISKKITDCGVNHYHNKFFLRAALGVGLYVSKSRTQGWSCTGVDPSPDACRPTEESVAMRDAAFAAAAFDEAIFEAAKTSVAARPRSRDTVYMLKYQCKCPPPHNSIRSGRRPSGTHPLNARCLDCNSPFECVDLA